MKNLEPKIEFDKVYKKFSLNKRAYGSLKNFINEMTRGRTNKFNALKNVSFKIYPGETVGIIGLNGSGKSTALKIIAGVMRSTSGKAVVNGKVAPLIQVGAGFHPELTGYENIFLNGTIMGLSKKEIREKIDDIIDFAEMREFIETPVKYYSSGMYMRLGFAIAVHVNADIILIDEVLAVGDLPYQRKGLNRMNELKSQGKTIVFVSHNLFQVENLCDRVIWLDKGRVVADGKAKEVINKYVKKLSVKSISGASARTGRAGSGEAKFESVGFVDEKQKRIKEIKQGQSLGLRLVIKGEKEIGGANVWIALINDEGVQIGGVLKQINKIRSGRQEITAWINTSKLLPGTYTARVGLFDSKVNIKTPIDRIGQAAAIVVEAKDYRESERNIFGFTKLDVEWSEK